MSLPTKTLSNIPNMTMSKLLSLQLRLHINPGSSIVIVRKRKKEPKHRCALKTNRYSIANINA